MEALDSKGLLTSDIKDTITSLFDEDMSGKKRSLLLDDDILSTQEPEHNFIEHTKKMCLLVENVPQVCGVRTHNGKACQNTPRFQNRTKPSEWCCGQHTKQKNPKNTLSHRVGSYRYATCMSLQVANASCDTNFSVFSDTCVYCKKTIGKNKSIDHIYPLIIKGEPTRKMVHSVHNKVMSCGNCNSGKNNTDAITFCEKNNVDSDTIAILREKMNNVPEFQENIYNDVIIPKYKITMSIYKLFSKWCEQTGNDTRSKDMLILEINDILKSD
jgi:hypothetical protein